MGSLASRISMAKRVPTNFIAPSVVHGSEWASCWKDKSPLINDLYHNKLVEVAGVARFEQVKTRGSAPLLRSAHLRSRWSLRQSRSAGSPPLGSEMRPLQCWTRRLVLWTRVGGGGGSRTRVPGTFTCSFYRLSSSIGFRVSAAEEHAALLLVPC